MQRPGKQQRDADRKAGSACRSGTGLAGRWAVWKEVDWELFEGHRAQQKIFTTRLPGSRFREYLVSSGCCNKMIIDGGINSTLIFHIPEAGSQVRVPADPASGEGPPPGLQMATFSRSSHGGSRGERAGSPVSSYLRHCDGVFYVSPGLRDAQVAGEHHFWVCLGGCFWKRGAFDSVDA